MVAARIECHEDRSPGDGRNDNRPEPDSLVDPNENGSQKMRNEQILMAKGIATVRNAEPLEFRLQPAPFDGRGTVDLGQPGMNTDGMQPDFWSSKSAG
jgi:hypothetical protein